MTDLKNEIHDYWTNRARGYSEYNQQEMADARRTMWRDKLLSFAGEISFQSGNHVRLRSLMWERALDFLRSFLRRPAIR